MFVIAIKWVIAYIIPDVPKGRCRYGEIQAIFKFCTRFLLVTTQKEIKSVQVVTIFHIAQAKVIFMILTLCIKDGMKLKSTLRV